MTSLIYNLPENQSSITNVLLISNCVASYQTFVDSANSSTFPIVYSKESSRTEVLNLLSSIFTAIPRIGFVFNGGENVGFLENDLFFSNEEVAPYSPNVQFVLQLIQQFSVVNIDYLGCNTLQYANWNAYYSIITNSTSAKVGASNDETGNIKYGGDWVLESTSQDIESVYFTKNIEYYQYVLDVPARPSFTFSSDLNNNVTVQISSVNPGIQVDHYDILYSVGNQNYDIEVVANSVDSNNNATIVLNLSGKGGLILNIKGNTTSIADGTSSYTITTYLIPTKLLAPRSVAIKSNPAPNAQANTFSLGWNPPSDTYPEYPTTYKITYVDNSNNTGVTTINNITTLPYAFSGLTRGDGYTFNIYAVNSFGDSPAAVFNYKILAYNPDAPTGVSATFSNGSANVSWTKPYNGGSTILSYKITSTPGNFQTTVYGESTLTGTVSGLTNGTSYTFKVVATNAIGDSPSSNESSPSIPAAKPDAPTINTVTSTFGDSSTTVNWSLNGNNGDAINDVRVYYSGNSTSGYLDLSANVSSHQFTSLTNGQEYTYYVTAFNKAGESDHSNTVKIIPAKAPEKPINVTGVFGDTTATVSWAFDLTNGDAVSTVKVYYSGNGTSGHVDLAGTDTSHQFTGLTNGQEYTYSVTATNKAGESAHSSEVNVIPAKAPEKPINVTGVFGDTTATVSWAFDLTNGDAVSTVKVYYSGNGTSGHVDLPGTDTSHEFTGLTNGQEYTYSVTATNKAGESAHSSEVNVIPAKAPEKPINVTGVFGDTTATVSWAFDLTNGDAVSLVKVYYSGNGTSGHVDLPGTDTSHEFTGLTNGQEYTYSVTATNKAGESAHSSEVNVIPAKAPEKPINVTGVFGDTTATVSWAFDLTNGDAVSTVKVYYSGNGTSGHVDLNATDTSHQFTGLTNGQEYTYSVTATNKAGESAHSSEVNVIPAKAPEKPSNIVGQFGDTTATVSWVLEAANGDAITAVKVYYSADNITFLPQSVSITDTSYQFTGLTNGHTYSYYVTSTNKAGESAHSDTVQVIPAKAPAAPISLSTTFGDRTTTVSWALSDNNGDAISNVTLYYSGTDASSGNLSIPAATTSHTYTGLTNGVTYTYYLTATNKAGTSVNSSTVTAIPGKVPDAPYDISATTDGAFGNDVNINITWTAPDPQGYSITSYFISYTGPTSGSGTPINPTDTFISFKGLHRGGTYDFSITATNAQGTSAAGTLNYKVPATIPDPPYDLSLNYTSTNLDENIVFLEWKTPYPEGANLTKYRIEYTNGDKSGTIDNISVLSQTPGDVVSYTINSLNQVSSDSLMRGTTFTFNVYAHNKKDGDNDGNSSPGIISYAIPAIQPSPPIALTAEPYDFFMNISKFTWTAPYDQGANITQYVLVYNDGAGHTATFTCAGNVYSISIPNMIRGSQYQITVYGVNNATDTIHHTSVIYYIVPSIPCFKEDTTILTNKGYRLVQDLRKGDLVKTFSQGFVPLDMIGYSTIYNPGDNRRIKHRLYKCSVDKYPELTKDLVITGCHAILIDEDLTPDELAKSKEVLGEIYLTENCYRIPAVADDKAEAYLEEGTFKIYHIALENEDYYENYGVYANGTVESVDEEIPFGSVGKGLLVESCSKRYLRELSNMTLLL